MNGSTSGKRGRKPLPSSPATKVEIASARRVLLELRASKAMSASDVLNELATFGGKLSEEDGYKALKLQEEAFLADESRLARFEKGAGDAQLNKGIYLWLSQDYSADIQRYQREEQLNVEEKFVVSCKEILGHGPELNLAKAESFAGVYKLYRPFHLAPTKCVTVGILTIGGESPFVCSLHESFMDGRKKRHHHAEGRIVPHGKRVFAILEMNDGTGSQFMLHFSDIQRESLPGRRSERKFPAVTELTGIMIAAIGEQVPSAWPCYAERGDDHETHEPTVVPEGELGTLPEPALRSLARGAIYWRESDYPKPFPIG